MIIRATFVLFFSCLFFSCDKGEGPRLDGKKEDFKIYRLSKERMPYYKRIKPSLSFSPTDEQGVVMKPYNNTFYYDPVQLSRRTLELLNGYDYTNDKAYLDKAQLFASKLAEEAVRYKNSLFFPYNFDFLLHGDYRKTQKAPWYSGTAQGQALSTFTRLYNLTRKEKYLHLADSTFNSFFVSKSTKHPWVVDIDNQGYVWIEEYPRKEMNQTLSGPIFAIYGLYDYYLLKMDKSSENLLLQAITTIKENVHLYRSKDKCSVYCLKHSVRNVKYHNIHIEQLEKLFDITHDDYFMTMSIAFRTDKCK
ncbi:D-glucuronyl C5-epimerase family protein [Fulvivirgaceae bacterium BMA10]|uniref:D-glucuronyl C5-epimerase family protein n=1 Tax=Splendidivirga corallicola TaxID=3051826 RepID=A0ABT8KGR4_9BACT|nr:D-glucuronyl C5-epimerase family protein [Fulvivirgaceae bacterium BMA10]